MTMCNSFSIRFVYIRKSARSIKNSVLENGRTVTQSIFAMLSLERTLIFYLHLYIVITTFIINNLLFAITKFNLLAYFKLYTPNLIRQVILCFIKNRFPIIFLFFYSQQCPLLVDIKILIIDLSSNNFSKIFHRDNFQFTMLHSILE